MEIAGRLTADVTVKTLSDDRQVVNFSVVQNNYYKAKDGERRNDPVYFTCSYWLSTKVAANLTKGTVVQLNGRLGLNAWTNMEGKAMASLKVHVNNIQFLGGGKSNAAKMDSGSIQPVPSPETVDDLPF